VAIVLSTVAERKVDPMTHAPANALKLAGVAGLLTAGVAASTIWLFLAQPLSIATAVSTRDLATLLRAVAAVIGDALATLVQYL
jgi:hypothetical protein